MTPGPATGSEIERDVVEWGADADRPAVRLPGWVDRVTSATRLTDRQLVTGTALLGAGFAAASLFTHWQILTLPAVRNGPPDLGAPPPVAVSVGGMGSWGTAYLVGLIGLTVLSVLVLVGPAGGRRSARLAGLAGGGALVAVLIAAAATMPESDPVLGYLAYVVGAGPLRVQSAYGPGLFCAIVGVTAATAALYLAGRILPRLATGAAAPVAVAEDSGDAAAGVDVELDDVVDDDVPVAAPVPAAVRRPLFARRQPRDRVDPVPTSGPVDLTVTPATPFLHLPENPYDR